MQLRITGEGSGGLGGGPPGDLYVLVRVREHDIFAREGADLHCDLPLTFTSWPSARSRGPGVGRRRRSCKIPAGTQPNEVLRIRGKGMPHLRERGHGDACYRVVLEVP